MAADWYAGIGGKARRIVKAYIGVNGKAREITGGYVGVGGKARRFWENIGDLVYKEVSWPRYGVRHGVALTNHIIWGGERDRGTSDPRLCAYDKNFTWVDIGAKAAYGTKEELGRAGSYVFMIGGDKHTYSPGGETFYTMSDDLVLDSPFGFTYHSRRGGACATFANNGYIGFGADTNEQDPYGISKISPDIVRTDITMTTAIYKAEATGVANDNYVMFVAGQATGSKPSTWMADGTNNISYVDKNDVFNVMKLPRTDKWNGYNACVYFNKQVICFIGGYTYSISNDMVITEVCKGTLNGLSGDDYTNCVATRGHIVSNGEDVATNQPGDSNYKHAMNYYWLDKNLVAGSAQRDTRGVGRNWGCGYWQGRAMFNACDHNESSDAYYGGKMYTFQD